MAETVRYAKRFGLVYLLLAIVVGIAAGTTINLVRGGREHSPWSEWKPTAPPDLRPKEIANRVASAYRLSNGRPLVDVVTGDPFQSVITEVATPAIGAGFGPIPAMPTIEAAREVACSRSPPTPFDVSP